MSAQLTATCAQTASTGNSWPVDIDRRIASMVCRPSWISIADHGFSLQKMATAPVPLHQESYSRQITRNS